MRCDDARSRLDEGAPLEGEIREHLASCAECRDEYAFIETMRAARPRPSRSLRARVLASFPQRGSPWRIVAWAASVFLALGAGFAAGHANRPAPETKIVEVPVRVEVPVEMPLEVPVEVEEPTSDAQLLVLGVALRTAYARQVEVSFEGLKVTGIRARGDELPECCPIVQEMVRVSKERPDLVDLR